MKEHILLVGLVIVVVLGSAFFVSGLMNVQKSNEVSVGKLQQKPLVIGSRLETSNVESDEGDALEEADDAEVEVPITGTALEEASAAALRFMGEGRVTDSEVGDEEGYYQIEITLDNGNEVDVHLDENFKVLSAEYENEEDDRD